MLPDPVFTVNTYRPSWLISTQHGAVCASANGESLYVNESRVDAIGVFGVSGGSLTELGSVSLPAGATPAGLAVK